jgi:hypothetical protein
MLITKNSVQAINIENFKSIGYIGLKISLLKVAKSIFREKWIER